MVLQAPLTAAQVHAVLGLTNWKNRHSSLAAAGRGQQGES